MRKARGYRGEERCTMCKEVLWLERMHRAALEDGRPIDVVCAICEGPAEDYLRTCHHCLTTVHQHCIPGAADMPAQEEGIAFVFQTCQLSCNILTACIGGAPRFSGF